MKTINDFTFEQQKQIVANDNELRRLFADYVEESEMSYIMDKLQCVKSSLSRYEISPWCYSFYKVSEGHEFSFIDGVDDCRNCFGLSTKCEKLLNRCKALKYTNLFRFYFDQLVETFWDDEIQDTLNWVSDNAYNLNSKKTDLDDTFECFLFNGYLDGYGFETDDEDEDGQQEKPEKVFNPHEITIYEPQKSRTIRI
jgi:hypothetical protein